MCMYAFVQVTVHYAQCTRKQIKVSAIDSTLIQKLIVLFSFTLRHNIFCIFV